MDSLPAKETLLRDLHPGVSLGYMAVYLVFALSFSHPLILLSLFLALGAVIISEGICREWVSYLKLSLVLVVMIMLLNSLFVRAGTTVLFPGPYIPGIGRTRLTLEALCYGAGMSLSLLIVISAFCLFSYGLDGDRILKLMGKRMGKIMLAISLSLRLFPILTADQARIKEIQICRGVDFNRGSWWRRAKTYLPVFSIMLVSSLERSYQLAESLHIRGYGTGVRTHYTLDLWRRRETILVVSLAACSLGGLVLLGTGRGFYQFYPRLEPIEGSDLALAFFLGLILALPALINWGWKKWPILKSKI